MVGADARVVSGTGYSFVVPSLWTRVKSDTAELAFGSFDGDDAGMSISATTLDAKKSMDVLAAEVRRDAMANGRATPSRRDTIQVAGRDVIVHELALRGQGLAIRGVVRAQTSDDGIISVVCHAAASSWESLKAGCDPILASMRVGAAAKAPSAPPGRMRWLEGAGFRVAIPTTWTESAGHAATTLAVARSGDDMQSMLVVTVIAEDTDAPPTEKDRDKILARYADVMTHRSDQTARVTRTAHNVVSLEFSREAEEQRGVLVDAVYDLGPIKLLLTCGGFEPAYSRHADVCKTAIRSVRPEPMQ